MDKDKRIHELECQLDVCREVVAAAKEYHKDYHAGDDLEVAEFWLIAAIDNYNEYIA